MGRTIKHKVTRSTVAIVGDGHTERIYFSDVRDTDRPVNLAIFPDFPRKIGSYEGVLGRAINLKESYDRVYALIDLDKVIQDRSEAAYAADKVIAENFGVTVLENNPCFEMWLLLHFIYSGKLFNNCREVSRMLNHAARIPRYDKNEKFLLNAGLYRNYKERVTEHAIPNARRLEEGREQQDPLYPRAETFKFFEWYFNQNNIM